MLQISLMTIRQLTRFLLLFGAITVSIPAATYYISPVGSNRNNGRSELTPWKTFAKAFASMAGGDTLVLADGAYTAATTGYINISANCRNCALPPNGIDAAHFTTIQAAHPGAVWIRSEHRDGFDRPLRLGDVRTKSRFIKLQGIDFAGAFLENTDHIYIKECGFFSETRDAGGVFDVGTNDHNYGNTYLLVEDCWAWGHERVIVVIFRSDHVVIRRFVGRQDGCDSSSLGCGNNSGNYTGGVVTYNSSDVSWQNVIVLDSTVGPKGFLGAADFCTAWHTNADGHLPGHPFGRNEWLGSISLNSKIGGFYAEMDSVPGVLNPAFIYRNIVAWNASGDAGAMDAQIGDCDSNCPPADLTVENATFSKTMPRENDVVYIGRTFGQGGAKTELRNAIITGVGRYGISAAGLKSLSYADIYAAKTTEGAVNAAKCSPGCRNTDPTHDGPVPSLKYLTRIENGSALKGTGYKGADYGANIVSRYGVDGAFYGDPNYNTLTTVPLWPWPNEDRIKNDFCSDPSTQRGLCNSPSLTAYVWGAVGNSPPPELTADPVAAGRAGK